MKEVLTQISNITWVLLSIIVIVDIILYILLRIKNKNKDKEHEAEITKLQNTIKENIEQDNEAIEEIIKDTEIKDTEQETKQEAQSIVGEGKLPYSRKMLLTGYEYKCYKLLKPLADKYNIHIMSKVKIIDFISVNRGLKKEECYSYICKIKQSHVDFVFCNPDNLYPLACLELDDNTHKSLKAQEKDNFKNEVFKSAGIKLYRINNLDVNLDKMMKEVAELNNN